MRHTDLERHSPVEWFLVSYRFTDTTRRVAAPAGTYSVSRLGALVVDHQQLATSTIHRRKLGADPLSSGRLPAGLLALLLRISCLSTSPAAHSLAPQYITIYITLHAAPGHHLPAHSGSDIARPLFVYRLRTNGRYLSSQSPDHASNHTSQRPNFCACLLDRPALRLRTNLDCHLQPASMDDAAIRFAVNRTDGAGPAPLGTGHTPLLNVPHMGNRWSLTGLARSYFSAKTLPGNARLRLESAPAL